MIKTFSHLEAAQSSARLGIIYPNRSRDHAESALTHLYMFDQGSVLNELAIFQLHADTAAIKSRIEVALEIDPSSVGRLIERDRSAFSEVLATQASKDTASIFSSQIYQLEDSESIALAKYYFPAFLKGGMPSVIKQVVQEERQHKGLPIVFLKRILKGIRLIQLQELKRELS